MLKTNSKKAIEKIKNYIMENYTPENYGEEAENKKTFEEIATYILQTARKEKQGDCRLHSDQEIFSDWTQGLPSLLYCEYYLKSAVEILGNLLEETEAERAKYDEQKAEQTLTWLIYRELRKAER